MNDENTSRSALMNSDSLQPMKGAPPPIEARINSNNWFELPFLRWGMMNRSMLAPTTDVFRGNQPAFLRKSAQEISLDCKVIGINGKPVSFEERLKELQTDGLIIIHAGKVIFEHYFHGMASDTRHGIASISKSFLGALAGSLLAENLLDFRKPAYHYVPELRKAAIGEATLQQILDMQVGIVRPSFTNKSGSLGSQDGGVYEILGLTPRQVGSPENFYDFILQKPTSGHHGQKMYYDNGPPEALAWIIRRITGRTIAQLLSSIIFQPLNPERDAFYWVDRTGAEFTAGGLAMTLRDMARFGEMICCDGALNGNQILSNRFIDDLQSGGNQKFYAQSSFSNENPSGSYRNYFHIGNNRWDSINCHGRFGQRLFTSKKANLVIAQFSSIPGASPNPLELEISRLVLVIAYLICS